MSDAGDGRNDKPHEVPHEAQLLSATRLFLIVVLFVVLAAYSIWNSDRFQTLLQGVSEQRLSELLKRPVSFRRVDFHIFPPSIQLADVRIDNDPRIGGEPLLAAAELTIGGGVSISGRELRLGRVRAVSPRISLVRFEDGTWNLPPGLTGPSQNGGLGVRIGELVVQRGLFTFEGRAAGIDGRLDDFAVELSSLGRRRYGGTLACRRVQLRLPGAEPLVFGLDLRFRLDAGGGASIEALRLVGEFGELNASGGVESFENPTLLLMTSGVYHVSEIERIFHSGLGFSADATVRAEIRIPPRGGFRISGSVRAQSVDAKGFPVEDLEATVVARPDALIARIERLRYAGGLASGAYRIEGLAGGRRPPPMSLELEARGVSIERFFGDIHLPGTGLSGQANLGIVLRWAEGGLERAEGGMTIAIAPGPAASIVRGRYGIPIAADGALSIVDGRILFPGTIFRFRASTLELTGGMQIGQWTPDFEFQLLSRDLIEVDRLFQNFTAASGGAASPLGLGGSGEVEGHITGAWGNPDVTANVAAENTRYAGVLFGSVRGATDMHDGAFLFHPLAVYDGAETISLEGTARYRADPTRPRFDLTATAKRYPIERVLDYLDLEYPISGRLSGSFPVSGTPPGNVSGGGILTLEDAVVWGQPIPRATARATLTPGRFELDEVRAQLHEGTLGGRGAIDLGDKSFEVRAAGDGVPIQELKAVEDVSAELSGNLTFELTASGSFDHPDVEVSAALSHARFHGREIPPEMAPRLEATLTRGQLEGTLSAPGHWTMSGKGEPLGSPGHIEVELDAADLASFALFTPIDLPEGVGGALAARGRFQWLRENAPVSGEVTITRARLDTRDRPGLLSTAGEARLRIANRRVALEDLHAVGQGIDVTANGALDASGPATTIEGHISGVADAAILELVRPGFGLSGKMTLDVGASGTVDEPAFNGSVRLEDGRYRAAGYSFEDVDGTLRLVGASGEIEGLRARVADGEAFVAGSFRLDGSSIANYRLTVQGRRISLRAIPALRLVVDADLVVSGDSQDREVRGEVTLLRGTYTKDVDLTVSDLLSKSRPAGALAAREPWKERTALDVRIVSAAALEIRNNVARLSGTVDLTARGTLADPILLGQVLLDEGGRVVFSDIRYEIESGAITFSNTTRIAPFVDLRARADVKGYDLVVSLVGTWPRVSANFASDPPLTNDEILGLVLSGTPPDTRAESKTTDQLVSAAGGIVSGAVTGGLTRGGKELFKLDRFQIDPVFEGSSLTTFRTTIGKKITQDLTVTSSIAVDSSKDPIVRIEWQVSDTIFVQLLRDEDGNFSVTFRRRQRL